MNRDICIEADCETRSFHIHDEMEILYILSGRMTVLLDNANFVLGPEDFVVFNPYENHGLFREQGCHSVSVYISSVILREVKLKHIECCSRLMPEQEEYLSLIRVKLAQLFKAVQEEKRNRAYVLGQIFGLLAILQQEFSTLDRKEACDEHVIQALRYIGNHFTQELSLEKVADAIHLSKSHLSRLFQKQTGKPFAKYVTSMRLNRAEALLRNTEKSVLEIALESGFSNSNTLNANFKAFRGITPSAYRQSAGEKETVFRESRLCAEISYMPLLKYAAREESRPALTKRKNEEMKLFINVHENLGQFHSCHREVISGGRAADLLTEDQREAVRRTKRDCCYKYLYFQGIFDDSMDVNKKSAPEEKACACAARLIALSLQTNRMEHASAYGKQFQADPYLRVRE